MFLLKYGPTFADPLQCTFTHAHIYLFFVNVQATVFIQSRKPLTLIFPRFRLPRLHLAVTFNKFCGAENPSLALSPLKDMPSGCLKTIFKVREGLSVFCHIPLQRCRRLSPPHSFSRAEDLMHSSLFLLSAKTSFSLIYRRFDAH